MSFEKQRLALRYWLLGRGYTTACDALEFAASKHTGVRKDGVTPEFTHQIAIASHVRTLEPHLVYREETIAAALLHDVREDYDVSDAEIRSRFGDVVADAVACLTKTYRGARRTDAEVFDAISGNAVASIVKPADRFHNQTTMIGVFHAGKIADYCAETREFVLPALKRARRRFPAQEGAYENLKLALSTQLSLFDGLMPPRS